MRVRGTPSKNRRDANECAGRDGYSANPELIYLSAGASAGVNAILSLICATAKTGVLVPIPQYPLYTATLAVLGSTCVPYYLDEEKSWGTNLDSIKTSYKNAQQLGIDTRAIAIINPGNPTGASLTPDEVRDIIKFAAEEKLVVIADEVYQTNVFIGEFYSFKKGLRDLQKEESGKYDNVELVSMHSVSKGMVGECGHRGGYYELVGFDEKVVAELYKFVSIQLCPPVIGQCIVECMVHPPVEGEESYELYKKEYDGIYNGLHERANALYEAFKQMEGVHCQSPAVSSDVLSSHACAKLLIGFHVPLPVHHAATKGHRRCERSWQRSGRILLSQASRRYWCLLSSGLRFRPEGRHTALPNDFLGARYGMGAANHQIP